MAAVVAHEVKNPLAGVRGAIEVIGQRLPRDSGDAPIVTEILSRLDVARELIEEAIPSFGFAAAVTELYHLTFDDFCDWYAEAVKPRLYDGDNDARATALAALVRSSPMS